MDRTAEWVRAVGQVAAGLALVAVLVGAAVEAVSADPAVGGPIVVAVVGLGGVVFERSRAEREQRREVQRERMEPMYKEFVERAHDRFASQGSVEATGFFTKMKGREFLLGADAKVIKALIRFEQTDPSGSGGPFAPALAYEALLRSIRRDLGHDDSSLARGDLLRFFTDYE
jgi:hypothetical protein